MIKDYEMVFSAAQEITSSAASTNVLDLGSEGDAIGEELWLIIRVGTALDSSGEGATLTIDLQGHDDASFGAHTHHFPGPSAGTQVLTFTEAQVATANTEIVKMRLPLGLPQFIRLYYTVSGENFTSGTIDAFLVKDPEVRL